MAKAWIHAEKGSRTSNFVSLSVGVASDTSYRYTRDRPNNCRFIQFFVYVHWIELQQLEKPFKHILLPLSHGKFFLFFHFCVRECVYGETIFCVCVLCACVRNWKRNVFFHCLHCWENYRNKNCFLCVCVHFWMKAIYKSHFQWQIHIAIDVETVSKSICMSPCCAWGQYRYNQKGYFMLVVVWPIGFLFRSKRCDAFEAIRCCTSIGFNRFSMTMKRMFCHFLCDSGEEISIIYGRFYHRSPSIAWPCAASSVLWVAY